MIRHAWLAGTFAGLVTAGAAPAQAAEAAATTPAGVPDFNDASGPDAISGGPLRYLRIAGSSFVPRVATVGATYAGAGCIRTATPGAIYTADVQLPADAVINYVRTYYYNNGVSSTINTYLTEFDGIGNYTEHTAFATATNGTGYASTLSSALTITNDPTIHSYSMVIVINAASADLRFCGVRIQYVQ